ncbi:bifunctional nuclease family protein [Desulfosarcina sp.]|uniref:bifunctional nuclease family protein n=1 Tax=Desulfosarcina sp. TaxID=2027861 RepID=UPI003970A42C
MLHKVNIAGLAMDPASNTPIILLKTEEGDKTLPIWIGLLEATSIASALQDIRFDRPMTHDLFKNLTQVLNVQINRIDICDLKDNTFYAEIHFASKERSFTMDARPSDAIALALRFHAPIFVDERVIEKSRAGRPAGEALDDSEEGKKWAEYLEHLNPEDFGKYKV